MDSSRFGNFVDIPDTPCIRIAVCTDQGAEKKYTSSILYSTADPIIAHNPFLPLQCAIFLLLSQRNASICSPLPALLRLRISILL